MEPTVDVQQRLEPLLRPIGPALFELSQGFREDMRVPARIVADEELLRQMSQDRSLVQLVNVTTRARERGHDQLGTLGGGNHFLELQRVEHVYDERLAAALGLSEGLLTVLIHTGSRGLGHQVCTDSVREMDRALAREGTRLVDRQLAHAPFSSRKARTTSRPCAPRPTSPGPTGRC